jgi:hypothetical protein
MLSSKIAQEMRNANPYRSKADRICFLLIQRNKEKHKYMEHSDNATNKMH